MGSSLQTKEELTKKMKVLAIFLLIGSCQCLPLEIEDVAAEPEPVADLLVEHRAMEEEMEDQMMVEANPEPVVVKMMPETMVGVEPEVKPEPMDEVESEMNPEPMMEAVEEVKPEEMKAAIEEQDQEPVMVIIDEMKAPVADPVAMEPMGVILVEEKPEAVAEEMMMESMAEPLSVLMLETEPVIYNIVDEEKQYNHLQRGVPGEAVSGTFGYQADGTLYNTVYTADERGYLAEGVHLPKSVEIPDFPKLVPVQDTDEVEALNQVHRHYVQVQKKLIADTLEPVDSGVETVRRRRSPVIFPGANIYNYVQPYPFLGLPPIIPSYRYTQFPQPTLNLAHPTYNVGLAFGLPASLVPNQEQSEPEDINPVPADIQQGEGEAAALAL